MADNQPRHRIVITLRDRQRAPVKSDYMLTAKAKAEMERVMQEHEEAEAAEVNRWIRVGNTAAVQSQDILHLSLEQLVLPVIASSPRPSLLDRPM
jgi:hypothetical protein